MKTAATSILKTIFSSWLTENDISETLIIESKCYITSLLTNEENESHQRELLSIFVSLIGVVNKDKVNKWEVIAELVIKCLTPDNPKLSEMMHSLVT